MRAMTTTTTAALTAQNGNGVEAGHLPYEQFELALTTPVSGSRPATTTTASMASASVNGTARSVRRRSGATNLPTCWPLWASGEISLPVGRR